MHIYLVQHGLALDKSVDAQRPLSPQGEHQIQAVASYLARSGIELKQIYHSGKTRAQQSAELFAAALNTPPVNSHDHLDPNDDPGLLVPLLSDGGMYVGHLPHLQRLVGLLVCQDPQAQVLRFENSAVVCLGRAGAGFYVDWLIKPSLLATA